VLFHRALHLSVKKQSFDDCSVFQGSNQYSLDFIESELIVAPVVEAGGAGALMVRHLLRDFELAAVPQILRDAGRAEGVATDLCPDAGDCWLAVRNAPRFPRRKSVEQVEVVYSWRAWIMKSEIPV
jgi:hypothetical protein